MGYRGHFRAPTVLTGSIRRLTTPTSRCGRCVTEVLSVSEDVPKPREQSR
jgi:hypothetical protein